MRIRIGKKQKGEINEDLCVGRNTDKQRNN